MANRYLTEACQNCPDWADGTDQRGIGCACHFPIMECPHFAAVCGKDGDNDGCLSVTIFKEGNNDD